MRMKLFIGFCFLLFLFIGCSEDKDEPVYCTEVFISINLVVEDADNKPIALDRYEVFINNKNVTLVTDFSSGEFLFMQEHGRYTVVNDSMIKGLFNKRVPAKVIGYIGDKKVNEYPY